MFKFLNKHFEDVKIPKEKPTAELSTLDTRITSLEIKVAELMALLTEQNYKKQNQLSKVGKILGRRF